MPDWLWWVIGVTSLLGTAYVSLIVGYFWGMFVWMHRNPNYLATQFFADTESEEWRSVVTRERRRVAEELVRSKPSRVAARRKAAKKRDNRDDVV